MKQLLARIDDDLHDEVRNRAGREGRSVNAVVTELLEGWVAEADPRIALRRTLAQRGLLEEVAAPAGPVPTHGEVFEMMRGVTGVVDALIESREDR